jgi:hypothetical protein
LPNVRRVLWAGWWGILKALESPFDVARHGDVSGALYVVPFECELTVPLALPVFTNFVVLFEGIE